MLVALALGAAAAGDVGDACAPAPADPAADPAAAALYREVADGERRAHRLVTAVAAYRAAAGRDPSDERSRRALAELCLEQRSGGAIERGLALMHAGDDRGAAAAFEPARAAGDPSAALLEGICLYRLGDDRRATEVLRQAAPDPGSGPSARFFLGLLALRDGRGSEATTLLDSAATADPQLATLATGLARTARREGRVVISAQAESDWDSNVTLDPSGAPSAGRSSDAMVGLAGAVRAAPLGESGPYVAVSGVRRDQARLDAYDLWGLGAAAGWKLGRGARFVSAEYGYDYVALGGAPYLDAHRLVGAARLEVARRSSIGATYLVRFEDYRPAAFVYYSGVRHHAEGDLSLDLGGGWQVGAAYHLGRDAVRDPSFSWWEHGPRVALRKLFSPTVRISVEAAGSWRTYDELDPVLRVRRDDVYADLAAALELDLASYLTLKLGVSGRRASSNVPEFTYTRVVPTVSLGYALGLF